jgi:hypothetical protein
MKKKTKPKSKKPRNVKSKATRTWKPNSRVVLSPTLEEPQNIEHIGSRDADRKFIQRNRVFLGSILVVLGTVLYGFQMIINQPEKALLAVPIRIAIELAVFIPYMLGVRFLGTLWLIIIFLSMVNGAIVIVNARPLFQGLFSVLLLADILCLIRFWKFDKAWFIQRKISKGKT